MQPFDKLTQENIEFIKAYINDYAEVCVEDLRPILKTWNKSKRTLFKVFGGELQVKIPVEVPRNTIIYSKQLREIYNPYTIRTTWDMEDFLHGNYAKTIIKNKFVYEAINFIIKETKRDLGTVKDFTRLFSHSNVEEGKTLCDYNFPYYNLTIRQGTKIAKAIQRILKTANYPDMHLFEEWRNAISNLNSNRSIKANLVLSINPIDYMTMSDNNCDWSSCMSWINSGMYSIGTVEMMNSNVAVVAYLESKVPYEVCGMTAPNKSWRALLFVHKDIMIVGKNYPYNHEGLCKVALYHMSKLVKDNLNWDYSFKDQLYRDLRYFDSNDFVRFRLSRDKMRYKFQFKDGQRSRAARHKIICYTRLMYNDMLADHDACYWCYRNKVDKTLFLNLSGRATCMCCGEYMYDNDEFASQEDCNTKVCSSCRRRNRCVSCHKIYQQPKKHMFEITLGGHYSGQYERYLCKDELEQVRYYPGLGIACLHNYDDIEILDDTYTTICKVSVDALRELGIRSIYHYTREISRSTLESRIAQSCLNLNFDEVIELTRFKSRMTEEELREVGVIQ